MPALAKKLAVLACLALTLSAHAQSRDQCETVDSCVAHLIAAPRNVTQAGNPIAERLRELGEPAVRALLPLLAHRSRAVRDAAGFALSRFERLDPVHLPALIAGYELRGVEGATGRNRSLPRAIAATGSGEALAYLEAEFARNPSPGGHLAYALRQFQSRLRPFVEQELARCGAEPELLRCNAMLALFSGHRQNLPAWTVAAARPYVEAQLRICADPLRHRGQCNSLIWHLQTMEEPMPNWAQDALIGYARSSTAEAWSREQAEDALIRFHHPEGLNFLSARLAALLAADPVNDQQVSFTLAKIGSYEAAAGPLASDVAAILPRADLMRGRSVAPLALARIGDRDAARAMLVQEAAFADDYMLAYNSVESLGRLRMVEARPMLERQARTHWHSAVRNNARRALNALDGREFALDDTAPFPWSELNWLGAGWPRYAGDRALPRWCGRSQTSLAESTDVDGSLPWPRRGGEPVRLRAQAATVPAELWAQFPDRYRRREPAALLRTGRTWLAGFNQGEWGGGLYALQQERPIVGDNVLFAFRMGGQIVVVTGLSHGVGSVGEIQMVDPQSLSVTRRIRLPSEPDAIVLTDRRTLVFETQSGDVALRADGRLLDPASPPLCARSEPSSRTTRLEGSRRLG